MAVDNLDSGVLAVSDLMGLKVAAAGFERVKGHVPEEAIVPLDRCYRLVGQIQTGRVSVRRTSGNAAHVLAHLVSVCSEAQLLACEVLLRDEPAASCKARAKSLVELTAGESICAAPVRGAVAVSVLG